MGEPIKVTKKTTDVNNGQGVDTDELVDTGTTTESDTKTKVDPTTSQFQTNPQPTALTHVGFMLPYAVSSYVGTIYRGQLKLAIDAAETEEKDIEAFAKAAASITDTKLKNDRYSRVIFFGRARLDKPFRDDEAKTKWRLKVANWAMENKDYHIAYDLLVPKREDLSPSPVLYTINDAAHQQAVIKLFAINTDEWIATADAKSQLGDLDAASAIAQKGMTVNVWKTKWIKGGVNDGQLGVRFVFEAEEVANRTRLMARKDAYDQSAKDLLATYHEYDPDILFKFAIQSAMSFSVVGGLSVLSELVKDHGSNAALVKEVKRFETELATIEPTSDANRKKIVDLTNQIKRVKAAILKINKLESVRNELKHLNLDRLINKTQVKIVTSALNPLPIAYFEVSLADNDYDAIMNYANAEQVQVSIVDWILSKHPDGFRQALNESIDTDVCYDRKLDKELESCVDYYELDPKDAVDLPFSQVFRNSEDTDIKRLMAFIDKAADYSSNGTAMGMKAEIRNSKVLYVNSISDLKGLTTKLHETFGVDQPLPGVKKGMLEVEKTENSANSDDDSHQRVLALNESMVRIDNYAKRMKGIENMLAAVNNPEASESVPTEADLRAFVDETIKDNDALIKSLVSRRDFLLPLIQRDINYLGDPTPEMVWRKAEYKDIVKDLQKLYSAKTDLQMFRVAWTPDNNVMHAEADIIESFKLMHLDGLLLADSRHARRLMEGECVVIEGIPILKEKGDPAGARDVNPIRNEMTLDMDPQEYFINGQRDLTGQSKPPKPVIITSDQIAAYHKRFGELRQRLSRVAMGRSIDAKILVLKAQADTVDSEDWFSLKTLKNIGFFLADSTFWDVSPDQYDNKDPFTFMAARYFRVRKEFNQASYTKDEDKFLSVHKHFLQLEHASDHPFLNKIFEDAEFAYNLKVGVVVVTLSAATMGIGDKLIAPLLVRLGSMGRVGMFAAGVTKFVVPNAIFVASNRIFGGAFQDGWAGAWNATKGIVTDPLGFLKETIIMASMMKFIRMTGHGSGKLFDKVVGTRAEAYLQKMSIPVIENGTIRLQTGWQVAKELLAYGTVRVGRPAWAFSSEVVAFGLWEGIETTGKQLYNTGSADIKGNFSHALQWKKLREGGIFIAGLRFGAVLSLPITRPIHNATEKWIYKRYENEFAAYKKFSEETISVIRKFDPEKGNHEAFVKDLRDRLKAHRSFLDRFPEDISFLGEHKFFNEHLVKQLDYYEASYKSSAPIFAKGNPYGVKTMVMTEKYAPKLGEEVNLAVGMNYTFSSQRGPKLVKALHNASSVTSLRVLDNGVVQVEMTNPLTQQSHSMMFVPKAKLPSSEITKMQAIAASPKPKPTPELTVIQGGGTTTTPQTNPTTDTPASARQKKAAL